MRTDSQQITVNTPSVKQSAAKKEKKLNHNETPNPFRGKKTNAR